jgi:hypothetical protein
MVMEDYPAHGEVREGYNTPRMKYPKIQVKIIDQTFHDLEPLRKVGGVGRVIRKEVAGLVDPLEVNRLIWEEPQEPRNGYKISVQLNKAILEKSESFYSPPHMLIRAAANKVAARMRLEAVRDKLESSNHG